MALIRHELRRGRLSLIIWSAALAFLLAVCVLIYPAMEEQMQQMGDMFSDMGALSDAFDLGSLGLQDFWGYFGLEFAEMMGLGGSLFAALLGISIIAKEQKDGTAEFLLTHPISRSRVLTAKLLAMLIQIVLLNAAVFIITLLCLWIIGEPIRFGLLCLLFLGVLLLQVEIACITFGLSSLLRRGGVGIGLGLALGLYFLSLISNLSEHLDFLKYITPYGFANASYIVEHSGFEWKYLISLPIVSAAGIWLAYRRYSTKDIL